VLLAVSSNPLLEERDLVADTLGRAQRRLLALQHDDGHWCGELEGDTIVESEYLLTLFFTGRGAEPRARKAAEFIRRHQLPSGGWAVYPGGPAEVSASVKAYFVLKWMGDEPESLEKARRTILELGGLEACNSFTKLYLAIFGQYPWERCPAVPPEIVLLPDAFPLSIYRMSSWSRGIVLPLSVIWALRPAMEVPEHARIDELWGAAKGTPRPAGSFKRQAWGAFFRVLDRVLVAVEAAGLTPFRKRALQKAEAFILEHLEGSDGLGAILPPIINTIFALRSLGYPVDHPVVRAQLGELEKLEIEERDVLRIQPCFSPVWDTALAIQALVDSDVSPASPSIQKAARWLIARQCRRPGDYARRDPGAGTGGWFFEYRNEFYPDCDDTAAVLTALGRVRLVKDDEERQRALERGLAWQLAMQNDDGGWGAFERGCDNEVLTFIPFADHNAMIDPSCEDLTGRSLEAMGRLGIPTDHPSVRRAVRFLREKRGSDGTWYGRWGVNYIYGSWLALRGLELAGEDLSSETPSRDWFLSRQNPDGGWGELPRSYDDPAAKGVGPSTASQTSWALMALFALGELDSEAVQRGVDYLLSTQRADGGWKDEYWTGTGFPRVFYLRYHLYALYFPILALGLYQQLRDTEALPEGDLAEAGA
jgi:squalene-hopene/tetraprenyl-beta-curcumene cyclase